MQRTNSPQPSSDRSPLDQPSLSRSRLCACQLWPRIAKSLHSTETFGCLAAHRAHALNDHCSSASEPLGFSQSLRSGGVLEAEAWWHSRDLGQADSQRQNACSCRKPSRGHRNERDKLAFTRHSYGQPCAFSQDDVLTLGNPHKEYKACTRHVSAVVPEKHADTRLRRAYNQISISQNPLAKPCQPSQSHKSARQRHSQKLYSIGPRIPRIELSHDRPSRTAGARKDLWTAKKLTGLRRASFDYCACLTLVCYPALIGERIQAAAAYRRGFFGLVRIH